jgi:uroporphyrinogen decarboxylase
VLHLSRYLLEQVESGAQAVQIFDSWIGGISPYEFETSIFPHLQELVAHFRRSSNVPIIYFGLANHGHLPRLAELGVNCIGVDWTLRLSLAQKLVGRDITLQGNLDPTLLLPGNDKNLEQETRQILQDASTLPAHIFNVGHGVQPTTQISAIERVLKIIRQEEQGSATSERAA